MSEYLASLYENAYSQKDDKSLKLPSLNSDVVSKVSENNRKYVTVIDQSANKKHEANANSNEEPK